MPLYVGDYLGDTGHLSTTQHGAYLLLMMHYWRQGSLPEDDKQLAAITKLPLRIWLDSKETIQMFFHSGWQHKRIDEELAKMERATAKRAAAGQKGGMRAAMNRMMYEDAAMRGSNATAMLKHGRAADTFDHSNSQRNISSAASDERGGNPVKQIIASSELVAKLNKH
jgi:uncharacterized protein YdaU (DUF1376 family)